MLTILLKVREGGREGGRKGGREGGRKRGGEGDSHITVAEVFIEISCKLKLVFTTDTYSLSCSGRMLPGRHGKAITAFGGG